MEESLGNIKSAVLNFLRIKQVQEKSFEKKYYFLIIPFKYIWRKKCVISFVVAKEINLNHNMKNRYFVLNNEINPNKEPMFSHALSFSESR